MNLAAPVRVLKSPGTGAPAAAIRVETGVLASSPSELA
jgi:hypothetical protein